MNFKEYYYLVENEEQGLKSITLLKGQLGKFVQLVQKIYNEWDEEDVDTYANGGICHIIAEEFAGELNRMGYEAQSVTAAVGDQHVYTVFQCAEGVYEMDISPYTYETGGGYNWKKKKGVIFDESDISVNRLSSDPAEFEQYVESF